MEEAKGEFKTASTLNRAVDQDLYKKMGNSQAKPDQTQEPVAAPAVRP